jgi:hypothetical protein
VFQWLVLQANQVAFAEALAKADEYLSGHADSVDWDAYSRGCDGQLLHTAALISNTSFSESLDNVLSAAKSKLADGLVELLFST